MATVPLSATDIYLLKGIPFNRDYKNVRWFDNRSQQTSYFNSMTTVHTMPESSFLRTDGGTSYVKVDKNTDDLWGVNYIRFRNRGKWFFAFVTLLEYVNQGLTAMHFEVDVFQTWLFDVDFKPSYVVREHRPLWNADGTPVINTVDEGLNYGPDYDTVDIKHHKPLGEYMFLVIATKSKADDPQPDDVDSNVFHKEVYPTIVGTPQQLSYYVIPFKVSDPDYAVPIKVGDDILPSPPNSYRHVRGILQVISKSEVVVNNTVSVYVTDDTGLDIQIEPKTSVSPETVVFNDFQVSGASFEASFGEDSDVKVQVLRVDKVDNFSERHTNIADVYSGYSSVTESKLLMYPYTVLTLQDYKGKTVDYKNEYIQSEKISLQTFGSMGTNNKVAYGVRSYLNADNDSAFHLSRLAYDNALINDDPQDLPVINDMLSAYMQGNRNSIKTERSKIKFNAMTDIMGGGAMGVANVKHVSSARRIPSAVGLVMSAKDVVKGAGNSVLDLQAINSKIKDIDNTPPSLTSMGGNFNFDMGHGLTGVYLMKRQIKPEYRKKLGDFFKMYGYKFNEVKVPNFNTRENWNYVQTNSIVVTGNLNNDDLIEFKEVFDNGVTLWHTNDIGNYDLDNGVR